ncbi:DNA-binding response regulator [Flavobacterium magnum]|uniref:DNA-binding response regulator n=1 Tax=Flavobacterium magnum TaxID=2162713 RepID=A0A2S0RDQ8_9FLAO|nr:response regulator transcription factor [Flavobacterium magnum]AWA29430.1 DNA-binding response regulator [Flavobacterium magnum]
MTKIIIVDDHPLVIEGIKALIESDSSFEIVGIALNGKQTNQLLKTEKPDIIFMDINLPDCSGIDLCREILLKFPSIIIIGLSTFNTPSYIQAMLDSGAKGYLLKNTTKNEFLKALNTVLSHKTYVSEEAKSILNTFKTETEIVLTRREREVLQLIASGKSNTEIAKELFISPTTVDSHRTNLLAKFKTNNTALLVKQALKSGFIVY